MRKRGEYFLSREGEEESFNEGNIKKITYPNGTTDDFEYDGRNLLWRKHEGNMTTKNSFYYNDNGKLSLMVDGENNQYSYFYDGHDRITTASDPLGSNVYYGYDVNSNLTSVQALGINGEAMNVSCEYDALNRLTNQKLQKSEDHFLTTVYSYNEASQVNSITNPNNRIYNITRTGSGLPDVISDPAGNADDQDYDRRGWVKKVTETESGGRSLQTTLTHNVIGNLSQNNDSINREYNHFYNPKQWLDSSQDPEGGIVSYQYDDFGRLEKSIRHISYDTETGMYATTYSYDLNNNLKSVTDPEGNTTSYFYDQKDRLIQIKYPDGQTESVTYNNNDQIRTYTDMNGTYIANSYDAAGRLTNRNIIPASGVAGSTYETFDYDGLGRLITASNNDADVDFVYDGAGRQTGETVKWKDGSGPEETIVATYSVDRDFDDNGNKTSLTYPSGKMLTLTPDPLDRLAAVTAAGKNLVSYSYEGKAKITGKSMQNAVNMTSAFDDGRRPTSLNYTAINNQPVFAKTMDWNLVDLKKSDNEAGQGEEYSYDSGYRLRKVVDTKKNTLSEYQIDGVENIDSKKETKKGITQTTSYTQNQRHQLTGYNGVALTYDNNGNLTHYENQYVYNWRNQLVNVITGTGVNVSYKYDALGRRVEKKMSDPNGGDIVRYVHDGHQVLEERDGSGDIITRYTYGNGLDEPIEIEKDDDNDGALESYIPMQNTNGSVIGIAAGDGSLLEKIEYSDYGEPTFIYDEQAPQVDVVRTSSGNLFIRFSESIKTETANDAIKIKQGPSEISGSLTYQDEDRLVTFAPSGQLPQNTTLTVTITTGLQDTFGNNLESEFSQGFTHTGTDLIIYDRDVPQVELIKLLSGEFFITFTEEINPNSIPGSVELTTGTNTLAGTATTHDTKTIKFAPTNNLTNNTDYSIKVKADISDLSGRNLSEFTREFRYVTGDLLVYEKEKESEHEESMIGNNVLFQGRNYDRITGLYYFRARYFHPKLGRFLQTDPMGYQDSMNMYQGFNQNPVNFVDPMGMYHGTAERAMWSWSVCKLLDKDTSHLETANSLNAGVSYGSLKALGKSAPYVAVIAGLSRIHPAVGAAFGLGVLARGFFDSAKSRMEAGQSFGTAIGGSTIDVTGITNIYTAITSEDLSPFERGELIGESQVQLGFTAFVGTRVIKSFKTAKTKSPNIIKYNAKAKGGGRFYESKTGRFIKNKDVPWPKNDGFASQKKGVAKVGQLIDRFGPETGRFFSPKGTAYQNRGIPVGYNEYHLYEVLKPLHWKEGYASTVPKFGSIGGGYQYKTFISVKELIARGYLKRIQ